MRTTIPVLLLSFVASTALAGEGDRALTSLLLQHHDAPKRADLERHVPNAKARLLAVAADPRMVPLIRDRAIVALAEWPDREVKQFYEGMLEHETTTRRHRVVLAYAQAFPKHAPARLKDYLRSNDVELALTAVTALSVVRTAAARMVLEKQAIRAERPRLKAAIDKALRSPAVQRKK